MGITGFPSYCPVLSTASRTRPLVNGSAGSRVLSHARAGLRQGGESNPLSPVLFVIADGCPEPPHLAGLPGTSSWKLLPNRGNACRLCLKRTSFQSTSVMARRRRSFLPSSAVTSAKVTLGQVVGGSESRETRPGLPPLSLSPVPLSSVAMGTSIIKAASSLTPLVSPKGVP